MNVEVDYYAHLGVLPSIDQGALAAVYRALLKKYHPDVYLGDKSQAEAFTKRINEAYEVLGSVAKRAEYDRLRKGQRSYSGDFESEGGKSDGSKEAADENTAAAWKYIVRYYPDAERQRIKLSELSSALGLAFQITLLETKSAADAAALSDALRNQFLERYFGTNTMIQEFASQALGVRRRDVALEVNKAIKILGTPKPEDVARFIETVRQATNWPAHSTSSKDRETKSESEAGPSNAKATPKHQWTRADWLTFIFLVVVGMALYAWVKSK